MTDWADDEAGRLDHEAFSCGGGGDYPSCSVDQSQIAAALRKAKASGMREAAEICDTQPIFEETPEGIIRTVIYMIESAASKLDTTT